MEESFIYPPPAGRCHCESGPSVLDTSFGWVKCETWSPLTRQWGQLLGHVVACHCAGVCKAGHGAAFQMTRGQLWSGD